MRVQNLTMNRIGVVTCNLRICSVSNLLQCSSIHLYMNDTQNVKTKISVIKKSWRKKIIARNLILAVCWHWSKMSKLNELLGLDKVSRLWAIVKHNGGIKNSLHKLYKWVFLISNTESACICWLYNKVTNVDQSYKIWFDLILTFQAWWIENWYIGWYR